jgi:minor extracellular serine protease Vpr
MKAALALLLVLPAAILAQPVIADGGILNGASFERGQPIAPGELVSLFGSNLAASLASSDTMPLSIEGVFVTINGIRAPLNLVSPGQINAQVPWEVGGSGNATVIVNSGGVASAAATVPLAGTAPGFFMVGGSTQVIAVNPDGTIAAAPGSIQGLNTHGARAGETLVVYATGLGAVTPTAVTGRNSMDQLRSTVVMPNVTVGGVAAPVVFSGLAPQFVGVNQLNITVPSGVAAGASVPIRIEIGGRAHQATIAITQ